MAEKRSSSKINEQSTIDLFDTAVVIKNASENQDVENVLITSLNLGNRVVYATVHLAKLLQSMGKKVLVLNLDHREDETVGSYFREESLGVELSDALRDEEYLSSAISKSQYKGIDFTTLNEIDDTEFINLMLTQKLKEKMEPLNNYYDVVLIIGPEHNRFDKYSSILTLADAVITVINARSNHRDRLMRLVGSYKTFGLRSFGVLRSK